MNRNAFIIVRRDDTTGADIDYWNGTAFGDIAGVDLFTDKVSARFTAAQAQQQFQTHEIDYRAITITINMTPPSNS
jgi:hypothetical protein